MLLWRWSHRLLPKHLPRASLTIAPTSSSSFSSSYNTPARFFSSNDNDTPPPSGYAIVNHHSAYQSNIDGRHGRQLSLAYEERVGKEYYDERLLEIADTLEFNDNEEDDTNDEEDETMQEATLVNEEDDQSPYDDEELDSNDSDNEKLDFEEDLIESNNNDDKYNADGSPKISAEERAALRAGAPAGGTFAVIKLLTGESQVQYKVTVDDVVVCNKLKPADKWKVGDVVTLTDEHILLVGSPSQTLVGLPSIRGASVKVRVEESTRDKTMVVFKKRRRKHSKRKNGFRRPVMLVRILEISFPEGVEVDGSKREGEVAA